MITLGCRLNIAESDAIRAMLGTRDAVVVNSCAVTNDAVASTRRAIEWCSTGRVFDAAEALDGGLVRTVVPPDRLLPRAIELAREIADNTAPVSVAMARQMMWRGLGMAHPMEAHRIDSRAILSRGRSGDAKEGVTSFLEKRAPAYPDTVSRDMPDFFPWWEEQAYR